tara:strand:- start:158 stop:637 length:480 start_codon:yes stop_codon:yes gene_type:complete
MNPLVKVILRLVKKHGLREGLKKADKYKSIAPSEYNNAMSKALKKMLKKPSDATKDLKVSQGFTKKLQRKIDDYEANKRIMNEANRMYEKIRNLPEGMLQAQTSIINRMQRQRSLMNQERNLFNIAERDIRATAGLKERENNLLMRLMENLARKKKFES